LVAEHIPDNVKLKLLRVVIDGKKKTCSVIDCQACVSNEQMGGGAKPKVSWATDQIELTTF
jgi:hypothetical protein